MLAANIAYGQTEKDTRVEISYVPGELVFINSQMIGLGARNIDQHFSLHSSGIFSINKHWAFETGINYLSVDYTIYAAPGLTTPPSPNKVAVIGLPLQARFNAGKYFFASAGLLFDFEVNNTGGIEKQSGIGAIIAIGGKYDLSNGLGIFISPQLNFHRLFSQNKNTYIQSMRESVVALGIAYSF